MSPEPMRPLSARPNPLPIIGIRETVYIQSRAGAPVLSPTTSTPPKALAMMGDVWSSRPSNLDSGIGLCLRTLEIFNGPSMAMRYAA